ncbi:TIGR03086 family metal-binding protein [Catenuloplanes atrovinosus]|uniref:Uncharacterized protein (TIGR03086 family) n=1 Tax=Catenuloplanes atrovinosus TaxID=137266 RepID=A0AAE4CA66_9ACTN|nr:TIGR03086 family metal-binding protein [Catenuloplanes atrovinosus]MDR7274320.1 uncharacterized protein (TIGR03086 family) [Catenuloplanes atrovinosus]
MTETFDLRPAARELATLVATVPDDRLTLPTPCPGYSLGDLLAHVAGLALAFRAAADKALGPLTGAAPSGEAASLPAGWRTEIPRRLDALADAWAAPAAWEGMTEAGGVTLPGAVAGLVAADELVVHGWDVARALGRPFTAADSPLEAAYRFVLASAEPGAPRDGLFGPIVPVPDDAPLLDRVLGLAGRDPAWEPPRH